MNWYDVVKWCNARSEKEKRIPAYYVNPTQTAVYRNGQMDVQNSWVKWDMGYRLPTEAEWEKAARGGASGHRFPWTDADTITHSRANYLSSTDYNYDVSPTRGSHPTFAVGVHFNILPYTSPVGYFAPNSYSLYDMAGNVWEWCWDWYGVYPNGSQSDTRGPTSGSSRVSRGASWRVGGSFGCRSAARSCYGPLTSSVGYPSFRFYGIGFRSVLPPIPEWKQVIEIQPLQPIYSEPPTKIVTKDSLVIVTHGWIRKEIGQTSPPNPDWVDTMVNLIRVNIASQGLNNWQVESCKWVDKAWFFTPITQLLDNAEKEGGNLGNHLASQKWNHIHLIGHSAGAAVIQAATLNIKSKNINTVVHTTFLDPYVGFTYGGRSRYGLVADWADNYFAFDIETFDGVVGTTQGKLDHAYTAEVTWLDPNKVSFGTYRSAQTGTIEECYKTVSSHSWPVQFYMNTILPNTQQGSQGFGFPLSKEGGNWNFARANYSTYSDLIRVLGTLDTPCYVLNNTTLASMGLQINFSQTPSVTSETGSIQNSGNGLRITSSGRLQKQSSHGVGKTTATASEPAWIVASIIVTSTVNLVSFDAEFLGTNATKLLTVYWGTNTVGSIDERVILPGLQHYTYSLPTAVSNSSYTLGFRMDLFSNMVSSVVITNVTLGFVGVPNSFSLSFTGKDANGFTLLKLTGPSGFNYSVETSTNLINWNTMAVLVNTNGAVPFVDKQSSNSAARFYRVVGY